MNNHRKYLFKFYIFVFMYIFMAAFIVYLTFRADTIIAVDYGHGNIFFDFNAVSGANAGNLNKPMVIIDAGHGGRDGGASGLGDTVEKEINLAIALKLGRLFKMTNYEVVLTRETDISLNDENARRKKASDLSNRVEIANKYPEALFISIHMNKFPQENSKGMQIFFSQNNLDSANLAELLKINNKAYLQPDNRREIKRGKDIYVLERIKNVGILIECGFLSNHEEAGLLMQNDYQNKLAKIIFATVAEFERKF